MKYSSYILDGAHYEGQYEEGKKKGKGKLVFTDGSYYDGEFDNNDIHGRGFRMNYI